MKNTTNISNGWVDIKGNWVTPPGTNRDLVIDNLQDPYQAVQDFEEKLNITADSVTEIVSKESPAFRDLFEIPLQNISKFDISSVIAANTEAQRHIKGLFKSAKEFQGAFDGRYFRMNYKERDGGDVNIVYDLKDEKTNKKKGICIKNFLITNPNGKSIDLKNIAPNSDMYYHKHHWITWIIAPWLNRSIASTNTQDITVYDRLWTTSSMNDGIRNPISPILHEAVHVRRLRGNTSVDIKSYNLTRVGLTLADISSLFLAIGVSPWFILPSLLLNIYTYILSRSNYNALGSSYHDLLIEESNAFYLQAVLGDLLTRKGFIVNNELGGISEEDDLALKFNVNYIMSYQPIGWAGIDLVRMFMDKNRETNNKKVNNQALPLAS